MPAGDRYESGRPSDHQIHLMIDMEGGAYCGTPNWSMRSSKHSEVTCIKCQKLMEAPSPVPTNPFQFIKAAQFFPAYAPQVKNPKEKLSGKVAQFTDADKAAIRAGLAKLFTDLSLPGH